MMCWLDGPVEYLRGGDRWVGKIGAMANVAGSREVDGENPVRSTNLFTINTQELPFV
jgi:hypothetical protein